MSGRSLAIQPLLEDRSSQGNNFFWSRSIKGICHLIDKDEVWDKPNILCKSTIINVVISNLKLVYNFNWYSSISTVNSKFKTNCQFKTTFRQCNYVLFFNRTSQSAFSKLRVSAHCLRIERKDIQFQKLNLRI